MSQRKLPGSAVAGLLSLGAFGLLGNVALAQGPARPPALNMSRALNSLGSPGWIAPGEPAAAAASRTADFAASSTQDRDRDRDDHDDDDDGRRSGSNRCNDFRVKPTEFVGAKHDCGAGYPAGAGLVTAEWMKGMGLPDQGQPNSNAGDTRDNPAKKDRRYGLLLSKNGPTPDCSAAGARLTGTEKTFVINELGFDYRRGSHCGAGSPRFNAITPEGRVYFIGCAHGTRTPAPQDGTEWTRVRFNSASVHPQFPSQPPFQFGVTKVARLVVLNDEGTDVPLPPESPSGVGLIVLDNLILNGHVETGP